LGEFTVPSTDCAPFHEANGKPIVPCGAIANSLFNDSLQISSESYGTVPTLKTGLAWPSDKEIKFRNPSGDLRKALEGKFIKKIFLSLSITFNSRYFSAYRMAKRTLGVGSQRH
jgi:hypothetical protein